MPYRPSKNRINLHDIVSQPLEAVPDAVNAVLRRPEVLDDIEVQSLFHETSYILLRTEESFSLGHSDAASALIHLLLEGLTHSEKALDVGLTAFSLLEDLLSNLQSIFHLTFKDHMVPVSSAAAVDLAQIVALLSDSESLKDRCGDLFLSGLVSTLQDLYDEPAAARTHFQVQRNIAAALINLIKGSSANKKRLPQWAFLIPCLQMSVDVFFQLQCVEILYRVSRRQKHYITDLIDAQKKQGNDSLASLLVSLDALPNDESLLEGMMGLVRSLQQNRSDMIPIDVNQVLTNETIVSEATRVMFTPCYFVVLLLSASADHITVPFLNIRSVSIAKNGRVSFKLSEFYREAEDGSSTAEEVETVTLLLNNDQLTVLKASSVRPWIVNILQSSQQKESTADPLPSGSQQRGDQSHLKRQRSEISPPTPNLHLTKFERLARKAELNSAGSEGPHHHRAREEEDMAGVSCASRSPASSQMMAPSAKRCKSEERQAEPPCPNLSFVGDVSASTTSAASALPSKQSLAADAALIRQMRSVSRVMRPDERRDFFQNMHRVTSAKMELRRAETTTAINHVISNVEGTVNTATARCREAREEWFNEVQHSIQQLHTELKATEGTAAAAVADLNDALRNIKVSSQGMEERIACVSLRLQQTLDESYAIENRMRSETLQKAEVEIERQESLLDERLMLSMEMKRSNGKGDRQPFSLASLLT